ncbi:MAG: histidine--tRNA ligase [candidate division WOR-3 bacterium]|nr:histidine--tRNA ligase [candidate division WOR-3 bacterium]MDW8151160.1 histidine--tRNA ligase [candidate division WOR-3 bacterium]
MSSIPKGTRDFTPSQQIKREIIIEKIKSVFRKYGFDPIETPTFEYYKTLAGKYGEEGERLIYKFTDFKKRELALKYDLTVPLARFFSDHQNEIVKPFKRYQIQPVFRAEKPQRGRYREFYQCDIDILGSKNLLSDITIILTINDALKTINIKDFKFKINHRYFFYSLAKRYNAENRELELARTIDKLEKISKEGVIEELKRKNFSNEIINDLINLIFEKRELKDFFEIFHDEYSKKAYEDLKYIFSFLEKYNVDFEFDISLARGLDYYTGMIFEVVLKNVNIGSIASGGRYDNLVEIFTKYKVPAVGGSIGIDRLLSALQELEILENRKTYTDIVIAVIGENPDIITYALEVLFSFQKINYNVDLYVGEGDIRAQLGYANDKGARIAIILGEEEFERKTIKVKYLNEKIQEEVKFDEIEKRFNFKF